MRGGGRAARLSGAVQVRVQVRARVTARDAARCVYVLTLVICGSALLALIGSSFPPPELRIASTARECH